MGARTQARRSINGKSSATCRRCYEVLTIFVLVPRAGAYLAKRGKYSDSLIKSEMAL